VTGLFIGVLEGLQEMGTRIQSVGDCLTVQSRGREEEQHILVALVPLLPQMWPSWDFLFSSGISWKMHAIVV
jgi:hypothetical protein